MRNVKDLSARILAPGHLAVFGLILGLAQPALSQPASLTGQVTAGRKEPPSAEAPASQDALESVTFLEDLQTFARTPGGSDEALRSAAESDDPLGMARFCAITTHERYGIASHRPKDGIEYCRRLAEAGVPVGMFLYARAYQYGRGVTKDYEEAVRWYRAAADSGNPLAMNNLALMYDRGRGVDQDEREAERWYRKAAELNDAKAQRSLAWMYEEGRGGLPRNIYQAIDWWTKAADGGEEAARKDLERLGIKYPRGNRSDNLQAWAIGFLAQVVLALGLAYLLFAEFRQATADKTDEVPADGPAPENSSLPNATAKMGGVAAGDGASSRAVLPPPPRIPDDIRAAASSEEGATALLFALLMPDEKVRTHQLALLLKEAGPPVAAQSDLFARKLHTLDPRMHSQIIELVMSRLKALDAAARDRVYSLVTALVAAQPRKSIEALTLLVLFRYDVLHKGQAGLTAPAQYLTLAAAARGVTVIVSLFAHLAGSGENGFDGAMKDLGVAGQRLLPSSDIGVAEVQGALEELGRLAPLLKPRLVMTCFNMALVDGRVPLAQEELIRALCSAIDSPLPPALETA